MRGRGGRGRGGLHAGRRGRRRRDTPRRLGRGRLVGHGKAGLVEGCTLLRGGRELLALLGSLVGVSRLRQFRGGCCVRGGCGVSLRLRRGFRLHLFGGGGGSLGARGLELRLELAFLLGGGGHLRGFLLLILEVLRGSREPLGGGCGFGVLERDGGSDAGDRGGGVHPRGDGFLCGPLLGLHERGLLGGERSDLLSLLGGDGSGAFFAFLREEGFALGCLVGGVVGIVDVLDDFLVLRGEGFVLGLGGGCFRRGLGSGCRLGIDSGGRGGLGRGFGLGVVLGSLLGPLTAVVQDEHLGAELRAHQAVDEVALASGGLDPFDLAHRLELGDRAGAELVASRAHALVLLPALLVELPDGGDARTHQTRGDDARAGRNRRARRFSVVPPVSRMPAGAASGNAGGVRGFARAARLEGAGDRGNTRDPRDWHRHRAGIRSTRRRGRTMRGVREPPFRGFKAESYFRGFSVIW